MMTERTLLELTDIRAFCGMVLPQFNPRSGGIVNKTPDDARKLIGCATAFLAQIFAFWALYRKDSPV
jgi:hypothetical protein